MEDPREVNILQPCDDPDVSAVDCACLRPDGEYLDAKASGSRLPAPELKM